ncbi:phage tail protein [Kitasatospora sp. NPDC048540]|uniref:phage tail protein n=1 Tax=unclassified Kitasatospora TaxID=2633591 RepID=UPI00053B2853|nr:phage tail protein [Kitasatospora sp. MBT63]
MSASTFVIQVDGIQVATFSELSGINTEVESIEYISTGREGIVHTKQYGKTKPPTVTLKRGLDTDAYMWAWHQAVLQGEPAARKTCSLMLFAASRSPSSDSPIITYILENAWPSKLDIGGMKAGATEVVTETVVLHCDHILMQPAG